MDTGFQSYARRDNTILTVGRLGTKQKATEILLDAFKYAVNNLNLKGWKLRLVGEIEKNEIEFQKYIDDWYSANPNMKSLITFVGKVSKREEMSKEYRTAKVFAFPSRYEGYSISVVEAIINGCFIVATDIPSHREITKGFRYSASFPVDDIQKLAEQLSVWCGNEISMEHNAKALYECIRKSNSLYKICKTIHMRME